MITGEECLVLRIENSDRAKVGYSENGAMEKCKSILVRERRIGIKVLVSFETQNAYNSLKK